MKEQRIVDSGGVFSYGGKSFKVDETIYSGMIPPKAKVNVMISSEFGVKLEYRNIVFDVNAYIPPKRKPNQRKNPSRLSQDLYQIPITTNTGKL